MDELNHGPVRYRRPNSDQAPWEMISSAPVVQSRLTQSGFLDLCLADTASVEFKDVKPVVVKVNGEEIVLQNRFTFNITPVDLSDSSSRGSFMGTIGQLKRVRDSSHLRTKSSQPSNLFPELPDDLKALLSRDLNRIPEECSPSLAGDANSSTGSVIPMKTSPHKVNQAMTSKPPLIKENPQHKCSKLADDDKARFQGLLDRLNKKKEPPAGKPAISVFDVRSSDPAILAAKVKEDTVTIRSLRNSRSKTEVLESVYQPQVIRLQRSENSRDSGYGTGPSSQSEADKSASIPDQTAGFLPNHQEGTKKLNPAAAEFKLIGDTIDIPFLIPKRLSRRPLTESLFDAPGVTPALQTITPVRPPPGFVPVLGDVTATQTALPLQPGLAPHGNAKPEHITGPLLPHPRPLGLLDPRTSEAAPLPGMLSGPLPGMYPPVDPLTRTFDITPTVPYSAMLPPVPGPPNDFGTVSANPFHPFPAPGSLPNVNQFGSSPPPDVALPFVPPPLGFNPNAMLSGPPRPVLLGLGERQQPLFIPDGKVVRPHFPVTQKPRDHDPVKQQQYEAYLEWRKANEPGYHIRCKMRQANRIVRQHQMKQAGQKRVANTDEKTENPAWKSIVEKAKAVVASAAAVAAAEKRSRGDSVREEFKTKIQKSCSDLLNLGQQGAPKQSGEVQNMDQKDEK